MIGDVYSWPSMHGIFTYIWLNFMIFSTCKGKKYHTWMPWVCLKYLATYISRMYMYMCLDITHHLEWRSYSSRTVATPARNTLLSSPSLQLGKKRGHCCRYEVLIPPTICGRLEGAPLIDEISGSFSGSGKFMTSWMATPQTIQSSMALQGCLEHKQHRTFPNDRKPHMDFFWQEQLASQVWVKTMANKRVKKARHNNICKTND